MLNQINSDWTEKYRPQTLDDMILNTESRALIDKYLAEGIIDNILLCSRPGQGKTSLAKLLPIIFDCEKLYINASDENNVEVVRNKIARFSRTRSNNGNFKIVILDEADGFANVQAQRILRALMEEVSDTTRFIITANYKNRILDAIRSRCKTIDITPTKEGIAKRVIHILKNEEVEVDQTRELPKLKTLIERFYPDVRSIIRNIQSCIFDNVLKLKDYSIDSIVLQKTLDYILKKDHVELRKYLLNNEKAFNNDYASLVDDFYHMIIESDLVNDNIKPTWTIILADYLYKFNDILDPELNAFACFYKIMKETPV